MINKFFYTCLSGLLLTCSFGYSQSTTLSGSDNSWRIAINPNGTIRSYETYRNGVWDSIPFRNGDKSGPCWDGISLSLVDKNKLLFEGTQNQITYRLQYTSAGDHLALKAEITNHSQSEFSPLAARLIVGVNSEMRTFPDWNNKFFPTLLRCEKTHLWGYFMSPTQRILGICTSEPIASYNLNYIQEGNMDWSFGHQIKTASLDLLHSLPLPARHPQDMVSLRPGEKKQWTIHLGEIDKLEDVKPTLALWGNNPLLECSQYTVAEGETITYELFGCDTKTGKIELLTPSGKVMPVSEKSISFKEGKGVYTIRLTVGAKTSEAMVNVRENWSWYLKNARDHVFNYPPIIGLSCEQYYGYYTAFIGTKYFPDKAKDRVLIKRFENDLARMWDTVSWTPNPDVYPGRLQNHSTTMGILVKLWEATKELKYLEQAAHIADYLASDKVQTSDGVYRNNGIYYSAVVYPAKSMLELAVCEKRLMSEPVWKERYERHFNSAARAINDLLIRRDDIDTEGDLTFEDGMIACCALQLGLFGLWQENEELKSVYANAAKYVLDKHQCLEQLQIPDTRMRGATLRYWEALDVFFLPNQVMNSPHGWTGWKIYASYYLYLLTGDEFYLRDFMDTLGASAQIMAHTGKLRWAFLPDPFVQAKILVENPQQPRAAIQVDTVIGEQYLDMISPWYRPDDESGFYFFGQGQDGLGERGAAGDNTVQEIFKVMEECALTQAYLIVREDGSFQAWNCKATKKGATIEVVPNERYIDKLHVNSKIPTTVTVSLNGKKHKKEVTGMQWIGEQPPFLLTQSASSASAQRIDITTRQDTSRILLNPDKGWYHHYMDNSITAYGLTSEAELDTFPGMHHLFIRIPWVYLEPEEGQFRWETIDTVVTRYAAKGYKFSLDITCKETMGDALPYATPQWVEKAGAKGQLIDSWGSVNWEPDYNDPVFLEKLNNFHKAMAARYDGAEWLQDVTTGSIGEWGEGHSRQRVPADVVIKHLDILLNNYKNTQIVIGDDYLRNGKPEEETKVLREYVKKKRVSYRDDSILYEGVIDCPGSIQNVAFFEDVWKDSPTTLEMCHYYYYKDKYWSIPNGYDKGLDIIKDAIRVAHATFISPHGHIGEWQKDNPQAAWDIINRIGYWIVPEWAELKLHEKQLNLSVAWNNKGVAPAYKPYLLKIFLIDKKGQKKELPSTDAGNREWLPGITTAHYTLDASGISKGIYEVEILLYKQFRNGSTRPVQLGLKQEYESPSGAYNIGTIKL